MNVWQIRNILTTIALAACCGVATAGPEDASPGQPPASSEVKSETKQNPPEVRSEPKQGTKSRAKKGSAKATAPAKTKKATAAAKTQKVTAPAKSEKATVPAKTVKATAPAKSEKATAPAKTEKATPTVKSEKVPALKAEKVVRPAGITTGVTLDEVTAPFVGLHGIKESARWAPANCADTDEDLKGTVRAIDKEASKSGDRLVMARMAVEFRTPAEAILAERARVNAGWGEMVVAHTLLASIRSGVTIDHLFEMRDEGMGWGQIAHGLGLKQKDVTTAVRAEGRVIRGQSKPSGSPTPIASVEPQVVGMEGTVRPGTPTAEVGDGDAGTSAVGAVEK